MKTSLADARSSSPTLELLSHQHHPFCVVCSQANHHGLQLEFARQADGRVVASFQRLCIHTAFRLVGEILLGNFQLPTGPEPAERVPISDFNRQLLACQQEFHDGVRTFRCKGYGG